MVWPGTSTASPRAGVLGHLHDPEGAVLFHGEFLPQAGQGTLLNFYVDNGTGYLDDNAAFQIPHLPFF